MPIDDEVILSLIEEGDGADFTTPEVAEQLGVSKPAAWRYLSDLTERGLVKRHIHGGSTSESWSLTEEGRAYIQD